MDEKQTVEHSTEENISPRERFNSTLVERAESITSVRNDVFTTSWWQLALNFVLGAGALVMLILSMALGGTMSTVGAIVGVVLVVILIVYNMALRAYMPLSFLQYTSITDGKRYCFRILSKTRSSFSDGKNNIEVDRGEAVRLEHMSYSQYSYDFFKYIDADMRIVNGDTETFKGTYAYNGKTYKSKIVFKNGAPLFGVIGGARIKYFDVNNPKERFVVPVALKRAVLEFKVEFPKVQGLHVRDDVKDLTKQ